MYKVYGTIQATQRKLFTPQGEDKKEKEKSLKLHSHRQLPYYGLQLMGVEFFETF